MSKSSSRRAEAAAETRAAILRAAKELYLEIGYKGAGSIDNDNVVMVAGPVESGEVGEFCMWCHGFRLARFGGLRLAATTGSCCYGSFVSLRSIRPWGGGLRTGRCPTLNLREMSEA